MNLRFVPVFVVLLTMLVSKSNAQLSRLAAGGGLNYTNYLGYYSAGNTGINLRVTYDVFAKGTASVGFLYGFPMKTTDFATANSTNSSNTRSTIEVPVEDVMAFKTFYGNFNYFFLKENTSPFGMYATLGAGLTIASYESTYGTYDKINYSIPGSSETSGSEMGFIIQGGAGAQAKFGVRLKSWGVI